MENYMVRKQKSSKVESGNFSETPTQPLEPNQYTPHLQFLVDEFIVYLAGVRNYSPRTLSMYRSVLQSFIQSQGITIITDITVERVERYMIYRRSQGISHNTNCTFMNALRAFLIYTNKRGVTRFDINLYETPKRKLVRMQYVTGEEVNRMLSVIPRERDRLIILCLFTSGARVSELVQLTVENLVDNHFTIIAKGNKEHMYILDESVAQRLRQYLTMEQIFSGPVFTTSTGKPLNKPAITHLVRKAAKLAKISHNVTPHQFRHGFATTLLENGADVRTVQEMLGHDQIQTTMRYMHVTDARKAESHARFAPKVMTPYQPLKTPTFGPSLFQT